MKNIQFNYIKLVKNTNCEHAKKEITNLLFCTLKGKIKNIKKLFKKY